MLNVRLRYEYDGTGWNVIGKIVLLSCFYDNLSIRESGWKE